jgi:hypothetical protein
MTHNGSFETLQQLSSGQTWSANGPAWSIPAKTLTGNVMRLMDGAGGKPIQSHTFIFLIRYHLYSRV